jgi:hypothetical protein
MKELTIESIKDYQTCALLFNYRHQENRPETLSSREIFSTRFENTLKSVINYFFYKKQGGLVPSYSSILNRWEKLWFSENTTAYDLIHEQHESFYGNTASLTSKAAAVLLDFYNKNAERNYVPIAIDQQFYLPVEKNVKINSKFDLILFENGEYFVYKWVFNFRNSHNSLYQIDFSVLHEAFKHKFPDKINKARFGYYDLLSTSQEFVEYNVDQDDSKALKYWCATIEDDKKFVPRRGLTSYCKKCPFDLPCSNWKDWENS